MADVDINPFGEHESRTDEPMDEHIPLDPVTPGRPTWEPDRGEQETSFRGESQRTKLMKDYVRDLYKRLSENIGETPELFHYDYFKLEGGELYYIGSRKPLTTEGKLKSVRMLADILGKNRLCRLGFNIPVGRITARQAVMLNKAAEELPSESDITKADDIELQEIAENASGIMSQIKDVQTDTEDLFEHPLRELLGLDKQLRSIRGSLKLEVAKKVELDGHIEMEKIKLGEIQDNPRYTKKQHKELRKRLDKLNDELKVRQESINLLKGRLKSQITSFKETIAKVLDKDTSLGEKIRTLFREQGITIASILTAIGMAIGVLAEALLPGGRGAATASGGGEPPPKDEKGLKGWIRNKLKALASLLGKLGMKAAEALPGIIGGIISWILNRAKDVVGWVSQNLWSLAVSIGGLIYTYIGTRK